MLETINFKLKVITYLVMSGADQDEVEWRSQSVKGLMRWWFRAAGGRKEEEKKIFGHGGDKANASLFKIKCYPLRIKKENIKESNTIWKNLIGGERYLGYSIKLADRKAIKPDTDFYLEIKFYPLSTFEDKKIILSSLWLAVNLGNIGTRARRGFGSLEICEPLQIEDFKELKFVKNNQIKEWYKQNLLCIATLFENNLGFEVYYTTKRLADIGEKYKEYRKNFLRDERRIFGLPIKRVNEKRFGLKRFASPLIIKGLRKGTLLTLYTGFPDKLPKSFKKTKQEVISGIRNFINELRAEKIYP